MTDMEKVEMLMLALAREQQRSADLEEELLKAESSRDWAYDKLAELKAKEARDDD